MSIRRTLMILLASIVLASPPAAADERSDVDAACRTQQWLSAVACPCIADRAMANLNGKQRAWLIAGVRKDQTEANRLQGEMTNDELLQVGTFMAQNPVECQQ